MIRDRTEDATADAATDGRTNVVPLLLLLVAMILIPLGLIVLFLAFSRGERAPQNALTTQTSVGSVGVPPEVINGRWIVGGPETWVGYSVGEELLSVPTPNTAEGRTSNVEGGLVIADNRVIAVAINADLRDLKSDDPERDEALRTRGLQTDQYPFASFNIAEPIALPASPKVGEVTEISARGDLTVHGVTKQVDVRFKAQLVAGDPLGIEVVGDIPLTMSDYGIEPPNVAGMISVQDHGLLRVHLRFVRLHDEVATNTVPPDQKRPTGTLPGTVPSGSTPTSAPGTTSTAVLVPVTSRSTSR